MTASGNRRTTVDLKAMLSVSRQSTKQSFHQYPLWYASPAPANIQTADGCKETNFCGAA
jgi:hypothetical protein